MHDLPCSNSALMAFMREHENACSCHQKKGNTKQTLTLARDSKPSN